MERLTARGGGQGRAGTLRRMSWLGRLFRPTPPPPPPNSVVIADDVADQLRGEGVELQGSVDLALRAFLEAQRRAREASTEELIPFWLRRESGHSSEMEEALRDRVTQRRAAEQDR